MGDIGEETHVHGVHTLLLLLLHLCLTCCPTGLHQATTILIDIRCQQTSQYEIDEPCPPRPGRSRFYHDLYSPLVADRLVVGTVGGTYAEGVSS